MQKNRLHLIDEYRGFVVLNMIAYHTIWDLVYIYGENWRWYKSEIGFIWQQWICWSFILVSGFCWNMGKKQLKRGMLVYGAGVVVSLVTILVIPESRVVYGVLTLLGSSMLLMIPLDLLLQKVNAVCGGLISFFLFLITYPINNGYIGLGEHVFISLPKEWYANSFSTYLGFMEKDFFSTDYFSIIPWFFLYVTGYFIYQFLSERNLKIFERSYCPFLGWIGRKALIIYMLHQPVIYGVLSICK